MIDVARLTEQKPPNFLFCAVEGDFVDVTFKRGLKGHRKRLIVMYESEYEARKQIPLKDYPVAFAILSDLMHEEGFVFYKADTGEWLTEVVPPKFLRFC